MSLEEDFARNMQTVLNKMLGQPIDDNLFCKINASLDELLVAYDNKGLETFNGLPLSKLTFRAVAHGNVIKLECVIKEGAYEYARENCSSSTIYYPDRYMDCSRFAVH